MEPWPEQLLDQNAEAMGWSLPRELGGADVTALELHLRYEELARQSLGLALILTQRDSAVRFLLAAKHERLLEQVRQGMFVTVGIAQLTTSRQGGPPALVLKERTLNGLIPWCTGAAKAKYIIAGAAGEQGQMLVAIPSNAPGVTIDRPMELVALSETWTSSVRCENVRLDPDLILLRPSPNVLSLRLKSVPIPQAFLALGHSRRALDLIGGHDSDRARSLRERFTTQLEQLHTRVVAACQQDVDPATIPLLRGQCNDLALRITHAAVALYKGTALLLSHPAQRLAREAMFLLVWSCPDPVIDCTVDLLST